MTKPPESEISPDPAPDADLEPVSIQVPRHPREQRVHDADTTPESAGLTRRTTPCVPSSAGTGAASCLPSTATSGAPGGWRGRGTGFTAFSAFGPSVPKNCRLGGAAPNSPRCRVCHSCFSSAARGAGWLYRRANLQRSFTRKPVLLKVRRKASGGLPCGKSFQQCSQRVLAKVDSKRSVITRRFMNVRPMILREALKDTQCRISSVVH